jgi:osmotically-inducible protein OsmY
MAGSTRGVINVTDEMTVPRGDVADAELAKAVTSVLSDAAANLDLQDLDVQVVDGVLTLQGKVKDLLSRTRAEDVAGTVLGVTRISNHLVPADAPSGADDRSLLKAVVAYLNDFRAFGFPSDITVKVEKGTVTLKGRVALYVARQRAALAASLVKGVARVDNRIKVDPSTPGRITRVQAER